MKYILRTLFSILLVFSSVNAGFSQDTLKVMQYNILFYGDCMGVDIADKDIWLDNITGYYKPDIFAVNEMSDRIAYANRIKSRALTYGNMEFTEFTNSTGSDLVNMLFYNPDKLGYKGIQTIPGNAIRDINVYTLYHKNSIQGNDTTFLDCIVGHLKAGSGSSDRNQRMVAANNIMSWIDAQGPDYYNYLVMGDFNIYNSSEAAWQTIVFNSNPNIRLNDPSGAANGWGGSTPGILTQSTRLGNSGCGAGGGLDDRFDYILTSKAIDQGSQGIQYISGSYGAFANNGSVAFNGSFDCSGNTSIPSAVCASLVQMSDHLPIVMELTLAKTTPIERGFSPLSLSGLKNPFSETLTFKLNWSAPLQTLAVTLFTPTGQQVYGEAFSPKTGDTTIRIPTHSIPSGMYFLRVQPEKGLGVLKKVVKR